MAIYGDGIDGGSGSTTGGALAAGLFELKAGAAIAEKDIVELGPNGKAWPVQTSDYAAVANCNYGTAQTSEANGRIVAQTSIVSHYTSAYSREAVVRGTDGSIYTLTADNSGVGGLRLTRYSAPGALIDYVTISAVNVYNNQHVFLLGNGNIAVAAHSNAGVVTYAVYDANLNPVKAPTNTEAVAASDIVFTGTALSGGGFALVYQQNANRLLSRLLTLDNAGNIVLPATTIWTRVGTAQTCYHRMVQLSDGNLAITGESTNTVSGMGLYHGVVTTAGVTVLAFANLDAYSNTRIPEISAMNGYYCVAMATGTNQLAFVFNNTGALQGAGFTSPTTTNSNRIKLVNDGTAFWLIWPDNTSGSLEKVTKIPTTGTNYASNSVTLSTTTQYDHYIDAFCENGFIVATTFFIGGSTAPQMWVVDTVTGKLVNKVGTTFGSVGAATSVDYCRVIPGGDFSFISMFRLDAPYSTNLYVGKYANTAVAGVAQASAAAGALFSAAGTANAYASNAIKGTASKQFDHTTGANIYGNKGALMTYGAILKGF